MECVGFIAVGAILNHPLFFQYNIILPYLIMIFSLFECVEFMNVLKSVNLLTS